MTLFRRKQQSDLDAEIESHLQMAVRERMERGASREEAEHSARRELGNVGLVKEITREMWGWARLEQVAQDIRYGLRMLVKSPGFTLAAIVTLALGIGANTAIFSVVNAVLLNPLPYPDSHQLVMMHESKPNFEQGSISFPNFRDWRKQNQTLSALAIRRPYSFSLTGAGKAEQVQGEFVSTDFFPMLGVAPEIGRSFVEGEDEIGSAPLAMISEGFWKRKLGSATDVLGKAITLDAKAYTIVGVVPATFSLRGSNSRSAEVYLPIGQWNNSLLNNRSSGLGFHGIGRLKPGVSIEQARADLKRVTSNLAAAYPKENNGIGARINPFKEEMVGRVRPVLLVLLAAVIFVLLIACVNVANLLLARSTTRAREFAIRSALGASRSRVLRQLLTESIVLAVLGGGLGLLLAGVSMRALLALLPTALPRAQGIRLDAVVLIFTMVISLAAGVIFGLAPAFRMPLHSLDQILREGGRGLSGLKYRAQALFAVSEIAMALVLLIGAGLMIRSLAHLWRVNPGFEPHNVLTFGLSLPPSMMRASPDAIRAAFREFDAKIAEVPGVRGVSQTWGAFPLSSDDEQLFWLEGQPKPTTQNEMNWALDYVVEPDYLKILNIPLLRGRFFTSQDNEHAPLVAVIDQVFAEKFFPHQDPIGKRINMSSGIRTLEIVGVVGHVKQWGLDTDDQELRTQLYYPFMQLPDDAMAMAPSGNGVVVRFEGSPTLIRDSIRRANEQMSSEQVIFGTQTMDEVISATLAGRRFSMILLGIFAGMASLLASVGIYGVISYVVGQRTHEIGIRVALGAQSKDILQLVLGQGARMTLTGVGIGLLAALGLTRLMGDMLFGVKPTDPMTFASVAALLCCIALLACYAPARTAMKVDPNIALRYE